MNFLVLFMNSDERDAPSPTRSRALYPNFAPAVIAALRDTPLDTFCIAYAFSEPDEPVDLLRGDRADPRRASAAAPGSPASTRRWPRRWACRTTAREARPSLFNDSLEFALLTEHDAILLRMLYDPRLRPGMTAGEVRPLLPAIAARRPAAQLPRRAA